MALDPQPGSTSTASGAAVATAREPEDTPSDPAREARMTELRQKYLEGQYTVIPARSARNSSNVTSPASSVPTQ
ncbi:MAG: hypothetical protein JO138_24060 [Acidobacteriaceae bacterium]|nr:hypothetical protein [Acidobacteriaceae bacterium]